MNVRVTSLGVLAVAASLSLVMARDQPAREPDAALADAGQATAPPERESDVRSITDLLASFVKSYNAKDAKAIGELFTAEAEIEDEDGDIIQGRDAIIARFADTLAGGEAGTLSLESESLRFLGTDLAIEEGTASLSTENDSPPSTNRYSVIYARQGGRWLHARVRDEPEEEVSAHEHLKELEWLLGKWVNESDDEVVFTICKWSEDGNFLLRNFDVKVEGRIALRGNQRIGWDPQKGRFCMWVFDDRGGFAEGLFSRDDDRWVVKGTGVRSDGQSVSFATAITPLSKDRLRWETLERSVGSETTLDTDQFDLVRQPPEPGK
ncbi:MAG: SgcJ/EcaC family oxidoreductase [Isosphaeraceae bacterium]